MQIIKFLFIVFIFNLTGYALAGTIKHPEKYFYIEVQHKYGKEWTRIFPKDKLWICQTESVPYYEAKQNPLENFADNKVPKPQNMQTCQEKVIIKNTNSNPVKITVGCLSQYFFHNLVSQINKSCRPL